ncbi:MAG: hydantoinase B/oxoprolinase family protein [Pseudomonadota bacterium]
MSAKWEFWIDRGGTFTDIVAKSPDGQLLSHKLLSENPERYADAAVQGIRDLVGSETLASGTIGAVKMGTTVATNALLERKGDPVLLMITEGFGDLLTLGYQTRPELFALEIRRPEPLPARVAEVPERLDAAGAVVRELDEDAARTALKDAYDAGLRAVAIAFMHAHVNPAHEARVAELAAQIGFTQISTSHATSRLSKLVARGDTTVVDAYLSPNLRRYVDQVSGALDLGHATEALLFMQSNGGLADAAQFQGKDAILSGPAGGIVGMVETGRAAGHDRLIGFDMGGTSTDVSHFAGHYERSFETVVAGVRMRAPMMDIHTVAAGGGSICSYRDGRFQVGPESAGADPGPAAYRRGGPPTVTDCNVVLGKLNPDHFPPVFGAAGNERLDPDASRAALTPLADAAGMSVEEAAQGFLRIAVDNMANAIKKISVERGHDVSGYTLQSFGGAGGQHACLVAEALGMGRVMIHPLAGVLSAYGMGLADIRVIKEAQVDAPLGGGYAGAADAVAELSAAAQADVRAQGASSVEVLPRAHLRYQGAHQSLEVAFGQAAQMQRDFEIAHKARFGFTSPERKIEIELVAAEAVGATGERPETRFETGRGDAHATVPLFAEGWQTAPLYDRAALDPKTPIPGPAIITEPTGTNMVEPGWQAALDAAGNLILTRVDAPSERHDPAESPVMLEVMSNLFMSVADQMGATLANTAWSVNIKERLDFSCAIFDGAGELVANAPHVPVHLGSMSHAVQTVMAAFPDAEEGDAFVLNAPHAGGTHLPDVTVVTPVFVGGRAVYWLGSRGHHADIGGRTPGSAPPDSTTIEEEGVVITAQPLLRRGAFLEDEMRALLASGRYPCRAIDQNIADLQAQIAANETGRAELLALVARHGEASVTRYMARVQENAEETMRGVIRGLPGGSFSYAMDGGQRIEVSVSIDEESGNASVDFTGTAAQHPLNYNAPLAVTRAVVLYCFRTLIEKNIPLNEGCLRPIEIIVPEGSMLNPAPGAAVIAGNTEVSQAACNALFGALGVIAGSQATMNNFVWGNADFQNYETICGGTGAGPGFDGCDSVQTHMTNTLATDPEVLEHRFPVRLEEWRIREGSGGAGKWRGGAGCLRRLRFLEPVTVTTLCGHRVVPPFGGDGGAPGRVGRNWAELPDGSIVPQKGDDEIDLPAGSIYGMETPGGGGWGRRDA